MTFQRVIRYLLSLYLLGFFLYQLTPIKVMPYVNYAPASLFPKPLLEEHAFAYGVKTAFSNHTGSLKNLLEALEDKGFSLAFADVNRRLGNRLYPMVEDHGCVVFKDSETGFLRRLGNFLFETLPKALVGVKGDSPLVFKEYPMEGKCFLLSHDRKVWITTFIGLEIPSYSSLLSAGKNLYLSRDRGRLKDLRKLLRRSVVVFRDIPLSIFSYSEKSFYLPGEETPNRFRLVVETSIKNPIVVVYRNGQHLYTFSQGRVNVEVKEKGLYAVKVLTYKFRIDIFYFGVRTLALSTPIEAL